MAVIRRTKVVLRITKKSVEKIGRGDLKYKGDNIAVSLNKINAYRKQHGTKALIKKAKQEIKRIDRKQANKLAFPNGLVTGVDMDEIQSWYQINSKKITIVIPSYNDLDYLIPCIESIKQTTDSDKVKVIIVDDYVGQSNKKLLAELEDEQVRVVYRDENGGFAKAVNTGILASDKYTDIILLNSDTVAHSGWVEALQYGAYEFGVDTGVVGPKLLYPDGRIQSAGTFRNTEHPEWFDHYYRFQDGNYGPANIPQYCIAMTGACLYVKREFIKNVGILDDEFQFAFEDVDWCIRGWEAGYRSLYFPAAVLTHKESATRPKNKKISTKEKQSIEYFWNKWGEWFDSRNVFNENGQKRLIFVLQSFGLSGGIKNIFELADRLVKKGFDVEIWGLDRHEPVWPFDERLRIRTFKNYDRLINALSKEEAIKIATWWETAFPVWLSSVNKGIPVYFISEYETWFYPDDILAQATVVSCYRKEFRNITISPYNLEELESIGLSAKIVPCGYDDNTYKPLKNISREENVLLAVGRSFFQKNFEMTYKAWESLGAQRPEMWLYGFEPEFADRDPDKITYFKRPSNEEVNELYNKATVFIQTSRHEGFCLPILEAMAAGCPVVCTDSHGNRGFCFDEKNCLMVAQDDVEGAKKAIKRLLEDSELRSRLSKEALKTAKEYKWVNITKIAESFFNQVK